MRSFNHLVLDVVVGWNVSPGQHGKSQLNKACAVGIRLVRDGANQRASRRSNLFQRLFDTVLSHNGDVAVSLQRTSGLNRSQSTGVGCCSNQNALIFRVAMQKIQNEMVAYVLQPAAIHPNKGFDGDVCQVERTPSNAPVIRL